MSYFKNLWSAVIGKDPTYRERYLKQVIETKHQMQRADDYENMMNNRDRRYRDRELVSDRTMQTLNAELKATRDDLSKTLGLLQAANNKLLVYEVADNEGARECMAQTMLDKTNVALKDLLSAIGSDDLDTLRDCLYWLAWNHPMQEVAKAYYELRLKLSTMESAEDENPNHE